jgi:3-deoxy-D-manno-octulosonic-acid transferase
LKPFSLFYALLAALLYLVALPLIVLLSFKRKHKESIPARFFLRKNPPFERRGIWFHACSLGETKALAPVLERLEGKTVNITTITRTGQEAALQYDADVRYLPYEIFLPFWAKPQDTVVVLEAEFWYLLFAAAKAKGAKLLLLNARISERSYPKYAKMGWFYRRIFAYVDTVFCQSEADKARFESLGARNVRVIGNIKLAQKIEAAERYEKPEAELIVAASTHEGEEEPILDAYLEYAKTHRSKLAVVPRHPERFESVWALLQQKAAGKKLSRWSDTEGFEGDIVLVDAMGKLNSIYAVADTVVLGGAFRDDVGGHNPLEPARFGCRIISGKHFFHQKELFKYVHHLQFAEPEEILGALEKAGGLPPSTVDETIDLETFIRELT